MEALLSRYRNLTVLLVVIAAQLLYLAYQVKTNRDERLIRVWAVSAVTPMAGIVEDVRHNTIGFLQDYFILLDVREQNRRLKADNDRLRMENVYYRNQLATAEHAHALTLFQAQSPSKTVAARVIGNSTVATAKAVFIDRGSTSGIEKEMAVVTPEGVVGKVVAVYPLVSQVLLVTDPTFKVGIESQKGHVHGILNCGSGPCQIEQIQNEEKIKPGEWFFTSGEDRIFPKGFAVGTVASAQPGQGMKDIKLNLSGAPGGVDEVLVVLQGIHQPIPTAPAETETAEKLLPPPPAETTAAEADAPKPQTEADKIVQAYQQIGKDEGHAYGAIGSGIPDFTQKHAPEQTPTAQTAAVPQQQSGNRVAAATPNPTAHVEGNSPVGAQKSGVATNVAANPVPPPAVLGAPRRTVRPPDNSTAPTQASVAAPRPVLPLGAPHRKPTTTTTDTTTAPVRPQPQQ